MPIETIPPGRGRLGIVLVIASLSSGCGGTEAQSADAASRDAIVADSLATRPDIPWLADGTPTIAPPELTPCPAGWREVAAGTGPSTCDPYPEGGSLDCPPGQAHFPGESSCAPVGSQCPASDFSEHLPADRRVLYVQPGATGGDGSSPTQPYGSLTEFAVGPLPMGAVIALSRGTHVGPVSLVRGIVLWGACAAETTLTTSEPAESEGVILLRNGRGEVRDLTVANSPRRGVVLVGAAAAGTLEGVVVADVETSGLTAVLGAQLEARTIMVRDTRGRSTDGTAGRGLSVELGATANATRVVLERNREIGAAASDADTTMRLADAVIRNTRSERSDGTEGRGLEVSFGATADVMSVLLERNRDVGTVVASPGTSATLTALVVRATQGREADESFGRGLDVQDGAMANVTRSSFAQNHDVGVFAGIGGTALTVADVVIRDTQSQQPDGLSGRGLTVEQGALAEVTRALLERNHDIGAASGDGGTTLTLSDVVVSDTRGRRSDEAFGRGLGTWAGSTVEVTRARFEQNREMGVAASGEDARLTLSDVVIRGTQGEQSDGTFGRGLNIQLGATADVTRALLEQNREVAVVVASPRMTVTLTDIVARDTLSRESDGTMGRGLTIQLGSIVDVTRAVVERNLEVGVVATDPFTTATLSDVVVRDTAARDCVETTCSDAPSGHGVQSYADAALSMTRFVVTRAALCGVHLAHDAQIDLSAGEVREHAIGVCIQVEGYDLARLTDGVLFADNDTNLQATDLPVPEAVETVRDVDGRSP